MRYREVHQRYTVEHSYACIGAVNMLRLQQTLNENLYLNLSLDGFLGTDTASALERIALRISNVPVKCLVADNISYSTEYFQRFYNNVAQYMNWEIINVDGMFGRHTNMAVKKLIDSYNIIVGVKYRKGTV